MSRRAKGFQYLSGKYLEMKPSSSDTTMSSSSNYRSLSSLVSSSSDDPLITTNNRRPDPPTTDSTDPPHFNPFACRRSFDVPVSTGAIGGSADRVLMRQRPTAASRRAPGSRGGMPGISWSSGDRQYSVSDLVADYSGRFPVIVKVARGYYGDGNLQLPVGQVLQIHGTCEERRVRGTDAAGRRLSLSASQLVNLRVETIDSTEGARPPSPVSSSFSPSHRSASSKPVVRTKPGSLKLSDVLRENASSLPLTVAVTSVNSSSSGGGGGGGRLEGVESLEKTDQSTISSFPPGTYLTIESYYSCTYLLANVIENGWLDSSNIVLIPDDLRPSFNVALGLKDGTAEEWKDFSGMFARSARHIKFSVVKGYDGVIYDDWSEFSLTYPPDDDDIESGAAQMVDIDRYLISRQLLIPNSPDPNQATPSDTDNGRSGVQKNRFPKTSPRLSINKRLTSHFVAADPAPQQFRKTPRDFSADATPCHDRITDALRSVPGKSNRQNRSGGQIVDGPRDASSSEADYANVSETTRTDRPNRPSKPRPTEAASRGPATRQQQRQSTSTGHQGRKGESIVLSIDEIAIEGLAVGAPEESTVVASVTSADDNRGTLISVDEGYNSGRFSVNAQSDATIAATTRRYSPVYF